MTAAWKKKGVIWSNRNMPTNPEICPPKLLSDQAASNLLTSKWHKLPRNCRLSLASEIAGEFFSSIQGNKPEAAKIIVSSHNYERTPSSEELGNLAARIQATGADIVKIATTATDITDCARIFQLLAHSQFVKA
ncbi:hypothetical protein SAY87_021998 [Trapa incisa]|uniref:Uncharacterized protein n=1 Tax=Trapa incisa TaxID=236973 RepID=A0AAN7PX68_9MYRT|nr:hypothetical protein SAY87_021998 [Trapa incisa]